jgi:hypothetical protein
MLDRITNKNPKHQEFGWKVFARRDEGKLESEYYNWCVDIKVGRWLKAKSSIIHRDYKVGFHCFKTETGAKWYREISHDRDILEVRKVKANNSARRFWCATTSTFSTRTETSRRRRKVCWRGLSAGI